MKSKRSFPEQSECVIDPFLRDSVGRFASMCKRVQRNHKPGTRELPVGFSVLIVHQDLLPGHVLRQQIKGDLDRVRVSVSVSDGRNSLTGFRSKIRCRSVFAAAVHRTIRFDIGLHSGRARRSLRKAARAPPSACAALPGSARRHAPLRNRRKRGHFQVANFAAPLADRADRPS